MFATGICLFFLCVSGPVEVLCCVLMVLGMFMFVNVMSLLMRVMSPQLQTTQHMPYMQCSCHSGLANRCANYFELS